MDWAKFSISIIIKWKKRKSINSVIKFVVKLSSTEKTIEGLRIVDLGKLFIISFSPASLLFA